MRMLSSILITGLLLANGVAGGEAATRVSIPSGTYKPLFGSSEGNLDVKAFWMDSSSVSNADFFAFVEREKSWRRGSAAAGFVDKKYLSHWQETAGKPTPKVQEQKRPVTYISWFAANAYCESKGGRLPTTLEWEYVAAASQEKRDASSDPKFQEKVLLWYTTRTQESKTLSGDANIYGIKGLHGSIWEWTSDFNAFFVTADNRQDGDQSSSFFCGGSATGAANRDAYPAFMRYALRSSLQANYSLNNLGFRCAYDKAN